MHQWELCEHDRNVHSIKVAPHLRDPDWRFSVLAISDLHWDNPKCNRALLKRHLDQAKEANAPIIVVGDFFCCMQGKYDPRSNKAAIRPEHNVDNYLDAIVDDAVEWFEPYGQQLAVVAPGNHEGSILKRLETDLIGRFCTGMQLTGAITRAGGYGGWLRLYFSHMFDPQGKAAGVKTYTGYYHHGFGGGGPVTKGAIDFNRYSEQLSGDVDWIMCGHVHWKGYTPVQKVKLNRTPKVEQTKVGYLRLGTYKDDYKDGSRGWHIERGQGARPLGGMWIDFSVRGKSVHWTVREAD